LKAKKVCVIIRTSKTNLDSFACPFLFDSILTPLRSYELRGVCGAVAP